MCLNTLPPVETTDLRVAAWETWCKTGTGKRRGDKKRVYGLFNFWYYAEEIEGSVVPISKPKKMSKK